MLRYARCPFTDGFMSNFTKSVGNFETLVKSASYVIHPKSRRNQDRWLPPRMQEAERQFNGQLITNITGGTCAHPYQNT